MNYELVQGGLRSPALFRLARAGNGVFILYPLQQVFDKIQYVFTIRIFCGGAGAVAQESGERLLFQKS